MRVCLPLMKNVLTLLAKRIFIDLGLMVVASATNSAIDYNDNHKRRNEWYRGIS